MGVELLTEWLRTVGWSCSLPTSICNSWHRFQRILSPQPLLLSTMIRKIGLQWADRIIPLTPLTNYLIWLGIVEVSGNMWPFLVVNKPPVCVCACFCARVFAFHLFLYLFMFRLFCSGLGWFEFLSLCSNMKTSLIETLK